MENESKPVGSESARQETASDTPQDALPPLPSTSRGKGRGKGRGRGKKDKSEQDSAYSSGSQAKRRVDESHQTQQTTPTTTSGDESRPSPNPAEMLAPNSPAQQAAKAQSLATLSEALDLGGIPNPQPGIPPSFFLVLDVNRSFGFRALAFCARQK